MPSNRHTYHVLPGRQVRGSGVPWPHDVRVALPPSYDDGTSAYPVLWVTDASLSFPLVVGLLNWLVLTQEVGEVVVVGVGARDESDFDEFSTRRTHDFSPPPAVAAAGPGPASGEAGGGAEALLSFLVDELRPLLADEFRFADDHGLMGYSDGGSFVGYALFSRPAAFGRYLAAGPALATGEDVLFTMEADHAAAHDDLPASVFLGAGEAELADPYLAAVDIVGSMARMAQLLRVRDYPSLELTTRVYPGQTHGSALALSVNEGLRTLYARPADDPG